MTTTQITTGENMSSGSLRLNRNFFNKQSLKVTNMHALSQEEKIGYPTVLRYLDNKEPVDRFKGEVLYSILIAGIGLSEDEAKKLTLGEVFEFVKNEVAVK